jgi:hypothetical protein
MLHVAAICAFCGCQSRLSARGGEARRQQGAAAREQRVARLSRVLSSLL